MSGGTIVTPKMSRVNHFTSDNVLFNLGMDEGSGDVFTEKVSSSSFTDAAGSVDHTTEPHAPLVGYTGALIGGSPLFTLANDKTFLVFTGTKVSGLGSFNTFYFGGGGGDVDRVTLSNTAVSIARNSQTATFTKSAAGDADTNFVAVKFNLSTNEVKVYDAVNLAAPALADTDTVPGGTTGEWALADLINIGNTAVPQPHYGTLAYKLDADISDADVIRYLDYFQKHWSKGQKVLIPGL